MVGEFDVSNSHRPAAGVAKSENKRRKPHNATQMEIVRNSHMAGCAG